MINHENNLDLIAALNNCATKSSRCAAASINSENSFSLAACINIAIDCAEICRLAASFASRSSVNSRYILKECIEIANTCAHECEKHSKITYCIECAVTCRETAKLCASFERTWT